MKPSELRKIAARGDATSEELRGALTEAAAELEGLERGRLELALLEPSLLESKNKDFGTMLRFSFGMLYEDSPEKKLGMVTRGCLAMRGYDGKVFVSPPSTRTNFGRKYANQVWTQALHDELVEKIVNSEWDVYIGRDKPGGPKGSPKGVKAMGKVIDTQVVEG